MVAAIPVGHDPDVLLDAAPVLAAPHDRASRRRGSRPIRARGSVALTAFVSAILLLVLTSGATLAATTVTPKCDAVNLRTGPSTTHAKKTSVNEGAQLTVVSTVTGGSY